MKRGLYAFLYYLESYILIKFLIINPGRITKNNFCSKRSSSVSEIFSKIQREVLKRDARKFSSLISKYNLDLYLNDSNGTLFKMEFGDNFMQLLEDKSYLDGSIVELVHKYCEEGNADVCIDVGANFGLVSILLARHSKKVFAFEPGPKNLDRMKKIINKNKVSNIEILPVAASNVNGSTKFFISSASSHHSLGVAHPGQNRVNTIDVETLTLDTFCTDREIEKLIY